MSNVAAVHGKKVVYEKNAYEGIKYLRDDLDSREAMVFFRVARSIGSAPFEDDDDRQFTLIYKSGKYTLVRR